MDDFGFDRMFERIGEHHAKREREFEKLAADPPMASAEVGGRALVSAGVIGMGFEWERLEVEILEVSDTAYRVRFKDKKEFDNDELMEMWVHRFVVTDVLSAAKKQ